MYPFFYHIFLKLIKFLVHLKVFSKAKFVAFFVIFCFILHLKKIVQFKPWTPFFQIIKIKECVFQNNNTLDSILSIFCSADSAPVKVHSRPLYQGFPIDIEVWLVAE